MKRILLMIFMNIIKAPFWFIKICIYANSDRYPEEKTFAFLKKVTTKANRGGRVIIDAYGIENIPLQNGFVMFPNHQGLYDALTFLETCPKPFSVINKKEVQDIPFLKQVFKILKAKSIDREDVKQAMRVILEVSKDVKAGRNYIIFAEGTRSKQGNIIQEFKGGSFKCAMYAKAPIVPVALIDAYKAFDTNSIEKITVQVHYLEPLLYEEYKDMKSTEIAKTVRDRIEKTIQKYEVK